jgi:hypothetical protein
VTTIPSAILQHWNSLYDLHPFSPLILTLDFILSSTTMTTIRPSLETVRDYLVVLPLGFEGVFARVGIEYNDESSSSEERDEKFVKYLKQAEMVGVVRVDTEGVKLMDEYKGWKGR